MTNILTCLGIKRNICKLTILIFTIFSIGFLSSCRWQDDFRSRQQPQELEQRGQPTLNPDSDNYAADELPSSDEKVFVPMPEIEQRHPVPEVPEHPAGV